MRPLLLRSPWIILATIGLLVAFVIVWLGARRARRPKDALVPSGGLRDSHETEATPAASKPVLRRLGESQPAGSTRRRQNSDFGRRSVRSTRPLRPTRIEEDDELGPILDDLLLEIDDLEERPTPVRSRPAKRRPAKANTRKTPRKEDDNQRAGKYIPLDEL